MFRFLVALLSCCAKYPVVQSKIQFDQNISFTVYKVYFGQGFYPCCVIYLERFTFKYLMWAA